MLAEPAPGTLDEAMSAAPDFRLVTVNHAENVALVRQALSGIAGAVRLDDGLLYDMKTAVSEACNNVVVHAYGGDDGPLEVDLLPEGNELTVVVRDEGEGIHPRPVDTEAQGEMRGVGLSLIQALTDRVEIGGGLGEGTEVRMTFQAGETLELGTLEASQAQDGVLPDPPDGDVRISVCGLLIGPVLSSVIAMLAARNGFSVERLSDAQILSDAIAAHGPVGFEGRHVQLAVDSDRRRLDLRIGPLVPDGGRRLIEASAVGGLEPLLERLTDELSVDRGDGAEELRLALVDPD